MCWHATFAITLQPVALKQRPVGNVIFIHDPCLFQTQISFRNTLKSTQYLLHPSLIWRSFQKVLHWAMHTQTYQAVEHLIKHCSQTPPVHCPVIRFPAENLWCQVLPTEKGGKLIATHKPLIFLLYGEIFSPIFKYIFHSLLESHRKLRWFPLAQHLLYTAQNLSAPRGPAHSKHK